MTETPNTISVTDRLVHARNILFDKKLSVLPVLDGENLIGLISEGMIARAFADFRNKVPSRHQEERLRYILVADALKTDPPTLKAEDSIGEAAKLMLEEGMRAIPIINDTDTLIGIVSKTDMVKLVKNNLKIE